MSLLVGGHFGIGQAAIRTPFFKGAIVEGLVLLPDFHVQGRGTVLADSVDEPVGATVTTQQSSVFAARRVERHRSADFTSNGRYRKRYVVPWLASVFLLVVIALPATDRIERK
jgi:hypothetical protein